MCPDGEVLSAYLDGELEVRWRSSVEQHLSSCPGCSARLEGMRALRVALQSAPEPDFVDAMARTRNSLAAQVPERPRRWRPVSVPLPVAALAALLLVALGCALVLVAMRPWDVSTVRITASPTGIRQFEVSGNPEDVRRILEALNGDAADRSVTIEIPKDFRFAAFGEPEIRPALPRSWP